MTYPFLYRVAGYDDEAFTSQGILFASSFAEASSKLEDDYGNTLDTIKLSALESGNSYVIPEDIFNKLAEYENFS